jgi:uncharacterized lipoprotein YmbA
MKRSIGRSALALLGVAIAGCAGTPAPGWHSLVPAAAGAAAAAPSPVKQTLVVGMVSLPDEVDRPQLVVRNASGTPALLDGERWSEPLKAQLPRSLALALARQLPGTLVMATPGGTLVLPTWRVGVDVQRFELQRGTPDRAVLRVVWTLRPGGVPDGGAPAAPSLQVFEAAVPATGGHPAALVAAMAAAVEQLSGQMSQSVCAAGPC